jgi:monoamine oxidase
VPIITTRNITFSNLSEAKKLILDNQLRTNAIKTFAFFKKPFWRKHCKASGDCLFSYDWALNMCHDISPED